MAARREIVVVAVDEKECRRLYSLWMWAGPQLLDTKQSGEGDNRGTRHGLRPCMGAAWFP